MRSRQKPDKSRIWMNLLDHIEHAHNDVVTTCSLPSTEDATQHQWLLRRKDRPILRVWPEFIVLHILVLEKSWHDWLQALVDLVHLLVQGDRHLSYLRNHLGRDRLIFMPVKLEVRKVVSVVFTIIFDVIHLFKRLHQTFLVER